MTGGQPELVEVAGVVKTFRDAASETPVLLGVSFTLPRGRTTSLVGASGAGKSTLISVLAGLLIADAGSVRFDGRELGELDDEGRAALRARRIGVVLQSGNLIPFLTARENIELAVELAGGTRPRARAEELLDELGLAERGDHLPRRLSGGEAQRLSLAVALANEPDLLLADEVSGELDSTTAWQVMEVIGRASREHGLTVLFVTHSDELAVAAHQRLRLVGGEVAVR